MLKLPLVAMIVLLTGLATAVATAQVPTPLPYNGLSANGHAGWSARISERPPWCLVADTRHAQWFCGRRHYKLRVGDTISYQIMEDRIWNSLDAPKPLVVTDSGEVDVPYIGRVMAVNKTCKELAMTSKPL